MSSLPRLMAGEQPDDTQGIATIEFKNGDDTVIKTLVGCIVHIRPMDKSLRNILKVENGNKNVKYFVYVPWFQSCRPSQLSESTILQIRLHRYRKPLDPKGFEVSKFDFGKYKDDQYFVIPCDKKNFQSSSFLKKWSSELLLYNNPTNISKFQANKVFNGFKKETKKFQEFKISDSGGVDQTVFSELEEQGVLQVHREKKRYVIGCYKKDDNNQIKMFSFLLKGLTEIEFGMPNSTDSIDGSGGSSVHNSTAASIDGSGGSSVLNDHLLSSESSRSDSFPNLASEADKAFINFLNEFASYVSTDWKFLGRRLGVEQRFIKNIDSENNSTEEKGIQMFLKWKELKGKEATPGSLAYILRNKQERVDLAEKVEEWMKIGQTNL